MVPSDCERIPPLYTFIRKSCRCLFIVLFLVIPLFLLNPTVHTAMCAEEPISASGSAPLANANTHDEALQMAFRRAIEQKVGIQVTSDTRIKNAEILYDEIYTYSEGFVEKYEITGEKVENGILTLEANIWVGANRLNKALFLTENLSLDVEYNWLWSPDIIADLTKSTVFVGFKWYFGGN
jgi:hypothetical protein